MDTGTIAGGHRYLSWWTHHTGTAAGGHRFISWWIQKLMDTVMAVMKAG